MWCRVNVSVTAPKRPSWKPVISWASPRRHSVRGPTACRSASWRARAKPASEMSSPTTRACPAGQVGDEVPLPAAHVQDLPRGVQAVADAPVEGLPPLSHVLPPALAASPPEGPPGKPSLLRHVQRPGHVLRPHPPVELLFRHVPKLQRRLAEARALPVRGEGDLGGLLIADVGGEGRDQHEGVLQVLPDPLL